MLFKKTKTHKRKFYGQLKLDIDLVFLRGNGKKEFFIAKTAKQWMWVVEKWMEKSGNFYVEWHFWCI